jgi:hypothetical protein
MAAGRRRVFTRLMNHAPRILLRAPLIPPPCSVVDPQPLTDDCGIEQQLHWGDDSSGRVNFSRSS